MTRLTIRTRLILLASAALLVLIATNCYLTRTLSENSAGMVKAAGLLGGIEQADKARIRFGEVRYWMTDLAVSQLTLPERNAAAARARMEEHLGKLEEEMAMLKAKFRALLPEDPLESLITGGTDLLTLRSTLDLQAETNRSEFDAIHRRIDRLESVVTPPEATGSVRRPLMHKRRVTPGHGQRAPKTN